jgi:Glycosyl transferase family 2
MQPTACFVSASYQNIFFGELLDGLAEALEGHGIAVERAVDFFPSPREGLAYLFVPHELMPLLMRDAWPSAEQLRRSVAICTEQPGTHWFREAAEVAQRAAAALDINRLGVRALRDLGVDAQLLQLGYAPAWDRWHGEQDSVRATDVALLAGATPRRLAALARCGDQLARLRTELHLPEAIVPHRADSPVFISGANKWQLLARSKLLLSIHRGQLGYFEWQRAVETICNGCVLLTEHSLGFEPLVAGEHFFSSSLDSLDVVLEGLLQDPARLARVRGSAYELLRERYPLSRTAAVLAEAVAEAAGRPPAPGQWVARDSTGPPEASEASEASRSRALPRPPRLPPPAWEIVGSDGTSGAGESVQRAPRVWHSPDRHRAEHIESREREVQRGVREVAKGEPELERHRADRVELLGARPAGSARVTALLAIESCSSSLESTIELLALSDFVDLELVLVESGCAERRLERLREALERTPWLATTLVSLRRPARRAQARNAGLSYASGELVLVLDELDAPHPRLISRLVEALDTEPRAAFAYGIVEQDAGVVPVGLAGYLGWEPSSLRYGRFLAPMAMLRRHVLLEVGGYVTDRPLGGYEQFALWCELADRGWHGFQVPEIVGRQVLAGDPARARSAGEVDDARAAWEMLRGRYRCLSASAVA